MLLLILLSGCEPDPPIDPTPVDPTVVMNKIGNAVVLDFNECKTMLDTVTNTEFVLCFAHVWDQRCPMEWCSTCTGIGGHVKIRWINSQTGDTATIPLDFPTCVFGESLGLTKDTLGYKFVMNRMDPYPTLANSPIPDADYNIKVKVSYQ